MKLKDVWKKKEVTLSFEAFPPKKDSDFASVASAVEKIAQLKPDFMSVTYGAGGGTSAYTGKIAQIVQAQGVTALAHLTCVSSDRDRIHHELDALCQAGIENILALRGDYPEGYDPSAPRDYRYARDLVEEIRAYGGFSIGGACYPEGHVECPSQREDLRHLKEKVDCGVDFLVTQMFFDNSALYSFLYRAQQAVGHCSGGIRRQPRCRTRDVGRHRGIGREHEHLCAVRHKGDGFAYGGSGL